eukprot:CAMPEP_0205818488 /NCGR_PEP_ID=MMETSP0206-20130828/413_1 /ASSEMBLY_ACC=CAM_ASM_000279 /TAXON_ID=36767 /ORGANISM="Euplotes focardii, Strain TN1" /LENGTH=73 /DNA_ID=CAMNT_0053110889 /DNA_START=30 /DNA_END=251 /DNA_ORIENTATION=-
MSHWRAAGMSYLQYLSKASAFTRMGVKAAVKDTYAANNSIHYKRVVGAGKQTTTTVVNSAEQASPLRVLKESA